MIAAPRSQHAAFATQMFAFDTKKKKKTHAHKATRICVSV